MENEPIRRKRWEYANHRVSDEAVNDTLHSAGQNGWELVAVVAYPKYEYDSRQVGMAYASFYHFFYKREIVDG